MTLSGNGEQTDRDYYNGLEDGVRAFISVYIMPKAKRKSLFKIETAPGVIQAVPSRQIIEYVFLDAITAPEDDNTVNTH